MAQPNMTFVESSSSKSGKSLSPGDVTEWLARRDPHAINELMQWCRPMLRAIADKSLDQVLKRRVDASDMVQETCADVSIAMNRMETTNRHPVATAIGTATVLANFAAIAGMSLSIQNFRSALSIEKESRQVAQQANQETAVARANQKEALLNITKLYTDIADKIIAGQRVEVPEMIPSFTTTIESLNQLDTEQREEFGIGGILSEATMILGSWRDLLLWAERWGQALPVIEEIEWIDNLLLSRELNDTFRRERFVNRLKHWQVLIRLGRDEMAQQVSNQIALLLEEWSDRPAFLKDLHQLFECTWMPNVIEKRLNAF